MEKRNQYINKDFISPYNKNKNDTKINKNVPNNIHI